MPTRLEAVYRKVRDHLFAQRDPGGYWVGELSASALSTATAITALELVARNRPDRRDVFQPKIDAGLRWLAEHQNADGGWGDTVKSFSNISTTMLGRAALTLCDAHRRHAEPLDRAEGWLRPHGKDNAELAEAVRKRYGKDRTFAVPILTMSALAGLIDWREVPRLPFELSTLPQSWYRFVNLRVVSYALPALIAIGQCVHFHRGAWNPLTWTLRRLAGRGALRVLERIQPSSGGYLEATPLTSFVVMSLASMKVEESGESPAGRVVETGVRFILDSFREDGSWPIDSNLSVWVTTLTVNALASAGDLESLPDRERLAAWLLDRQTQVRHPFTGADPHAWGWSHLPGSVPDCDDTPGALLALAHLRPTLGDPSLRERIDRALESGLRWVENLQNADGGWPTFCRGWSGLPFDRSGSDLTAHALRAKRRGRPDSDFDGEKSVRRAEAYLRRQQRADGSWLPLWFGNQRAPDDENPVYGTCRVLAAYRDLGWNGRPECQRAVSYLLRVRREDGSWGDPDGKSSSVEETALCVEALLDFVPEKLEKSVEWLVERVEDGSFAEPSPIGFYFAKLWYFERMYPLVFTLGALGKAVRRRGEERSLRAS
jgi:squalene-hopene/tetraprenyl-beta-curcumene cyclase